MKLKDLVNAAPSLRALGETKLKMPASYRVGKTLRLANSELTHFEESRMKLAEEFGKLSDDKKQYLFEGDAKDQFKTQMDALLDEEVDTSKWPKISLAELGDCSIEPVHLDALTELFGFAE